MTRPWHMARAASRRPLPAARKHAAPVYPDNYVFTWHEAKRAMVIDDMLVVQGPWTYYADECGVIWMRHRDGERAVRSSFWNRQHPESHERGHTHQVIRKD